MTVDTLLDALIDANGSDLYLTVGSLPAMRLDDRLETCGDAPLTEADISGYLDVLLESTHRRQFNSTFECNFNFRHREQNFRGNACRQRGAPAIVIRYIKSQQLDIGQLGLPDTYKDMAMQRQGLILVVGPTGSGKSTSIASMVRHRNAHAQGHIVTIEDPIEFIHEHDQCIITQREVGLDTASYEHALKNALRQRPDMVVIGEARSRGVMEHALTFSSTGHLCLTSVHAHNAAQAIERIVNLFPENSKQFTLISLATELKAIFSQRLVPGVDGTMKVASEILLNRGVIRKLIRNYDVDAISDMISRNAMEGMQTLDQALISLYRNGQIDEEALYDHAERPSEVKLKIRQEELQAHRSNAFHPSSARSAASSPLEGLM